MPNRFTTINKTKNEQIRRKTVSDHNKILKKHKNYK